MKQIVVISGKGGTGKTVITASFAALVENKVMADCDVDAADLHLLLKPNILESHEFKAGKEAIINEERCDRCGKCLDICRFEAIKTVSTNNEKIVIDPISCEGCGVCAWNCPVEAIELKEKESGKWFISNTKYGPMIHARLGIAEENSGKLVTIVRQNAKLIAEKEKKDYIIIDGPPGIGCSVIASLTGVDLALIVTEPTLSGMHDLDRVKQVALHFGVTSVVCINKYDINLDNTDEIRKYCENSKIEIVGELPFDLAVTQALVECKPIIEFNNTKISNKIKNMLRKIEKVMEVRDNGK